MASVYYCLYCHAVVQGSSRNLKVWVQMIKLLDLWMNALEISNFHEMQIQFLKKCGCSYTHCIQTSATPVVCRVLVQRLLPVSRVSSNFLPLLSTFHNLTTACTFSPTWSLLLLSHSKKNPGMICNKFWNNFLKTSYPSKYWPEQYDRYLKWELE